jgi:hypothetical protein
VVYGTCLGVGRSSSPEMTLCDSSPPRGNDGGGGVRWSSTALEWTSRFSEAQGGGGLVGVVAGPDGDWSGLPSGRGLRW